MPEPLGADSLESVAPDRRSYRKGRRRAVGEVRKTPIGAPQDIEVGAFFGAPSVRLIEPEPSTLARLAHLRRL